MSGTQGAVGTEQGNAQVIRALFEELGALGVREFCVCAGARNAALLEALVRCGPEVLVRSFYEERSAAFFALGRIMATRKPVAVVTTSGTAVAELFPAVMEAYYQAAPLVLITADRPSRYRGSGAPQAVEQSCIFGLYAPNWGEIEFVPGRGCCTRQTYLSTGPTHINVCLEEGLMEASGDDGELTALPVGESVGEPLGPEFWCGWQAFWSDPSPGIVLASAIHPSEVNVAGAFLAQLRWPVVAEATANLHDQRGLDPLMLSGGESALRSLECGRVLRLGGVPSWRWWRDLDHREHIPVLNLCASQFRGLARTANVTTGPWTVLERVIFSPTESGPGASSVSASQLVDLIREGLRVPLDSPGSVDVSRAAEPRQRLADLFEACPKSEPAWMRHLSAMVGAGASVFLGNSLPIREWNLASGVAKPGTRFFANRGANGIDGIVSTWLGVGADDEESWLIVGDLSAMYDLGAPWVLPHLRAAKRRIVVINNGGGKIFSHVSWLKDASAETRRLMVNPHEFSFEPWARMWGMGYRLVSEPAELNDDDAACAVWEVRPDAEQTEAFWREWQG